MLVCSEWTYSLKGPIFHPQSSEAKQLCNTISSFFNNKVRRIKDTIASRLAGLIHNPFSQSFHSGGSDETAKHHASQIVAHRLRANVRFETM